MVLRRLGFRLRVGGDLPTSGLIASNHLSYLDILFYGATLPCVFVAKREVRGWPLLGLLAALGGTVFVDRTSVDMSRGRSRCGDRGTAGRWSACPGLSEGTSLDGAGVLRFYPSLFEPAVRVGAPVTAAAIGYSAGAEVAERDLCYYGEISFAPHLLETLQLPEIVSTLRFASAGKVYSDRKQAATLTRAAVVQLRSADEGTAHG